MVSRNRENLQRLGARSLKDLEALSETDWPEPRREKRDWKKQFLILGLGTLSWVATYIGMLELIQANMGDLALSTKVVIGFSVAMLMTMIIWLLDQLFAPLPFATKLAYLFGYVFLTMISVGFGFGFYWKVLESRSEATRSAESAVTQVQGSLVSASSRLTQLQGTLDDLEQLSLEKAKEERERGTSCPNSRPGDGPRRKLRDADAARFRFASSFVKGRAEQVKSALAGLDGDLKRIATGDPGTIDPATGTRNAFMRALSRKLELTSARFNAFRSDPQLRQIRSDLSERATQTIFPTGRGNATFSCPDPQLQAALKGVVRAIDQLPELGKPVIATVEGSEAVIEAFRRLTATFYGALSFNLPPSADEMRELQKVAVRKAENAGTAPAPTVGLQGGLTKRDYVPLAIAVFVDLCLLLVSIGRPLNRLEGLVPRMQSAERGPVYQILSKFSDIHRDPEVREKFEVFRHVVFDFNGDYYVAVPLDAPDGQPSEVKKTLQQEAHLLANLFASFEKEKIFSRVINPLLSTRTIQKKLHRQGSKFSRSRAFRVYRFRDGAWSEIILGAIMGAAKRAQTERRRQILEDGPDLETGVARDDVTAQGEATSDRVGAASAAHHADDHGQDQTAWPDVQADQNHAETAHTGQSSVLHAGREAVGRTRSATGRHRHRTALAQRPEQPLDPSFARAFGRHAASAARDLTAADFDDDWQGSAWDDDDWTADNGGPGRGPRTTADSQSGNRQTPGETEDTAGDRDTTADRERLALRIQRLRQIQPEEAEIEVRPASRPAQSEPAHNVVDIAQRRLARQGQAERPMDPSHETPTHTPRDPSPSRLVEIAGAPAAPSQAEPTPSGSAPISPPPLPPSNHDLPGDAASRAPDTPVTPTGPQSQTHASNGSLVQHRVNVRITERTADFSVPVTDARLPFQLRDTQPAEHGPGGRDVVEADAADWPETDLRWIEGHAFENDLIESQTLEDQTLEDRATPIVVDNQDLAASLPHEPHIQTSTFESEADGAEPEPTEAAMDQLLPLEQPMVTDVEIEDLDPVISRFGPRRRHEHDDA